MSEVKIEAVGNGNIQITVDEEIIVLSFKDFLAVIKQTDSTKNGIHDSLGFGGIIGES